MIEKKVLQTENVVLNKFLEASNQRLPIKLVFIVFAQIKTRDVLRVSFVE